MAVTTAINHQIRLAARPAGLPKASDWQATEDDPERDMEPGKILHELRVGELARTGELPHRPYYGILHRVGRENSRLSIVDFLASLGHGTA